MEETSSNETLTSPLPLPILPFDVVAEILCRLPVKLLLQLQCMCKSWKSLISDPIFTKKHLCKSTPIHHLMTSSMKRFNRKLYDSPIPYVFSTSKITKTPFNFPKTLKNRCRGRALKSLCSCHGILCFLDDGGSFVLLNPSIRKFNILPPLNNTGLAPLFSFGYDNFSNKYKIVAIFSKEVSVYTLGGTHSWRRIQDFPNRHAGNRSGVFVSSTVNWLTYDINVIGYDIVSLDLEKETFQKFLVPYTKMSVRSLGVLKDCLCICATSTTDILFLEVWVMKEFGNKESWIKLYTVPYITNVDFNAFTKTLYIYEDDKLLLNFHEFGDPKMKFGVYDFKTDALKILKNQNINRCTWRDPEVYTESLILPPSQYTSPCTCAMHGYKR